jgi:2-oxoglutarate dehydrogenase complex dehydrogenase (E1) component-like enzyme
MLEGYPNAGEVVWVQEEPENMGAWDFIRPHLEEVAGGRPVRRVARPRSASPAEGSAGRHATNQQALIDRAFGVAAGSDGAVAEKAKQDAALTSAKG